MALHKEQRLVLCLESKYFNSVLYTGNGTTQSITGVGFQPDWTWIKSRNNGSTNNSLYDAVRGAGKVIFTNGTEPEYTVNDLTSFNSDGFSVSTVGATRIETNASGYTYVGWNWKANGAGSTNTSGSITSTVSANTTSGFSVVTYTGLTVYPQTIGHGLGVAPSMIIIKNRSRNGTGWAVYHSALGNTKGILLNSTAVAVTDIGFWNNTTPTSSVFTTGNGYGYFVNAATDNYVAYCFAEVAGYSKFTSWTGNGSADGPFIFTGFRPAYVLVKITSASGEGWWVFDNKRNAYNVTNSILSPNSSGAEITGDYGIDMVSNGFKIRKCTHSLKTTQSPKLVN